MQSADDALKTCLEERRDEANAIYNETQQTVHELGKKTEEIAKEYAACLQLLPNTQNTERCFQGVTIFHIITKTKLQQINYSNITTHSSYNMLILKLSSKGKTTSNYCSTRI